MAFFKSGTLIERQATTATSGGTTTLTVTSPKYQFFTGTATQAAQLPDATTLSNGQQFVVVNNSTTSITVNNNGAVLLETIQPGNSILFFLTSNSTTNGTWGILYTGTGGSFNTEWNSTIIQGSTAVLNFTGPCIDSVTVGGTGVANINTGVSSFLVSSVTGNVITSSVTGNIVTTP